MEQRLSSPIQFQFKHLLWAGLILQTLAFSDLWGQVSSDPVILGRYSLRYGVVLLSFVGLTLGWVIASIMSRRVEYFLANCPLSLILGSVGLIIVALFFVQTLNIEPQIKTYTIANGAMLSVVLLMSQSMREISKWRYWYWGAALVAFLLLPFLYVTNLVALPFNPDEAIWAERGSTYLLTGSLYYRTGFYFPLKIEPGLGWITAAYGHLLNIIAFDIRVGRTIVFIHALLIVLGVGLVAKRLYGAQVGWMSGLITFFSFVPFEWPDYRPHYFIVLGQLLAFYAVIFARQTPNKSLSFSAHFVAGLGITLSMQLHASALGFIIGLSLFYGLEFLVQLAKHRRVTQDMVLTIVGFGLGAALGSLIYFVFNILAVGGLETFLSILFAERGQSWRRLRYLTEWDLLPKFLIYVAFAFMIIRRSASDRLYLSLWVCCVIGITMIDTQLYLSPYIGIMLIPIGLITQIFQTVSRPNSQAVFLTNICLLAVLATSALGFINWRTVEDMSQNQALPQHYIMGFAKEVADYAELSDEEVIVSTHELIWAIPYHETFYSTLAEGVVQTQRDWVGVEVWNMLQPDVYIEIPSHLPMTPGLRMYLENNNFIVCSETHISAKLVRIHRQDCNK